MVERVGIKMLTTGIWKSDSQHMSAEFSVRHMMVSSVKGMFKDVSITFEGEPNDLENGKVTLEIGVASVETFDAKRDGHLKSDDFFNAEKYPKMVFKSKKIVKKNDEEYLVTGDLTIRNITKEITVDVEYSGVVKDFSGNDVLGFNATGELVREDFDLKWNALLEGGGVLVGSKVKFHVDGELVLQKEN